VQSIQTFSLLKSFFR